MNLAQPIVMIIRLIRMNQKPIDESALSNLRRMYNYETRIDPTIT